MSLDAAGTQLAVVATPSGHAIFYLAASEERQLQARALHTATVLIEHASAAWMRARVTAGMRLDFGGVETRHCHGERTIEATSGSIASSPPGKRYCFNQACAWVLHTPVADILVLRFTRVALECAIAREGGDFFDLARVHDGATAHAPMLAQVTCGTAPTVHSSGQHLFVSFSSDDLFNFAGFSADFSSGADYCAAFSSCGGCAAQVA